MNSLESKIDRLSPEQRKETEDFVDFLLSRPEEESVAPGFFSRSPPVLCNAPPPLAMIEPVRQEETRMLRLRDKTCTGECTPPAEGNEAIPASFHEIGGGTQDRISHDYMDYGQFESRTSPADESVKKVKKKLIARDGQDKPHHLLDWVD